MKTEKIYKCFRHGCKNRGIFPLVHSGIRISVETGTGNPVHVCADCLKAKSIEKQTIQHINDHIRSVNEWKVTISTKNSMDDYLFRNLQRDGYAVERITHGHKYGKAVADCSALNSVAKYIQNYENIEKIELLHKETGAKFIIPSEKFNAKDMRPIKDALRQNRYNYIAKHPFFVCFEW